ncbi:hypothetical protein BS47DRAFT_743119 [Hydnum rufescens UP504]|uniref:Uncharacterized protein n=1 Tax=Hydnum rufescens UP504 TaxID=1448309 RepID=A0A9P6B148_9AGAM|nr:hypothetical protein BS47DRAFT_743119 [Hydnum rufescens UP504]
MTTVLRGIRWFISNYYLIVTLPYLCWSRSLGILAPCATHYFHSYAWLSEVIIVLYYAITLKQSSTLHLSRTVSSWPLFTFTRAVNVAGPSPSPWSD